MSDPLVLIDASSYFFRAFHALPPLVTSKGQPTGAIYGVANMIKRLIKDHQPQHIAVIFDAKGKTFREDLYPEYKAHRPPMPSELSCQFAPLLTLIEAMGLPLLMIEGVEADDVIGTLAQQAVAQGLPVLISTSDKDMTQLVNEHVTLINTMTNQMLDSAGVKTKFGVRPDQIIDYLTLIGDSIDNIPGVAKCGPKTAAKWLEEYQTLENLTANAGKITQKIGENLRASLPQLPLSKQLVTIKTDIDLPVTISDLKPRMQNRQQLLALTREFEFKTWLKELLSEEEATEEALAENFVRPTVDVITQIEQLTPWINKLQSSAEFCLNTEITDLDTMRADLAGIAFTLENEEHSVYLPLSHQDGSIQLERDATLAILKPVLENPNIKKIGYNLKNDYTILKHYGITLRGIAFDTLLESYVINSTAATHDLASLALKYLGHKPIAFIDIAGVGSKQLRVDQLPVVTVAPYAAEKTHIILKLHQTLYPMIDEKLQSVFHEIEMPLLTVLADMERHGVLIDTETLAKQCSRLKTKLAELEKEALQLAGKPFNLNSPKQLQDILFTELQLPVIAKTPKGQPSTAEAVLQELAFDYRLPAVILEYRSLNKLVCTYIDVLPKRINPKTQRVHTSYNQAVAATGRLSSSDPNLQNIPIRTEEGRMIRKAFIAPPGHVLLAADYSQIELRIMAHLSQDADLLNAFTQGWDIHTATASEIFGIDLDKVSHEQRRRAKAVNFGLIYGMSSFGLAKQIGVEREDAQMYIDRYFLRYPGVLHYMERTRRQAHQQGYVETVFGRRLHLPEINARNMMRQKAAERTAINAPMQGTAADIIKKAMLAIAKWEDSTQAASCRMIMQVHDELIFEVKQEAVESVKPVIQRLMETTVELSVPLVVSIGVGPNWDEAH
ncbi:DNA polymerase I [Legionella sp. 27cVA30]|uniref:DNA polymerase I n=1 Tax=Legionella sp. 27cVA30 TaxID=2905657 RepID=UPI00209FEE5C|nr:DNA polymerase I [Legionella sp. 27cVA30]MCP0914756.1 DNA polymerase I [Legionella sp. 27cVA30]